MKAHKPSYKLVLFATAFALLVIILGAFTRLSDAGLGCPDWPTCYGFMWMPDTAEEIIQAEELYPHAPYEHAKAWPEVVHRYLAGSLGLLIIAILALAIKNRHLAHQPLKLPIALLVLVIAQGLFGMWTVTLKLWPQVVTGHLIGGFTTASLLWLLCLRLSNTPWPQPSVHIREWVKLKPLALLGLILVSIQIMLGGWVSSNYAALACPDLPTCQAQWWPEMDFASGFNVFQEVGPNYLGGQMEAASRVAIHMAHRIGAIVVAAYLIYMLFRIFKVAGNTPMKSLAVLIAHLIVIQICLGLSNVIFDLPLAVAVSHNAVGALLLLSLITLNYRLRKSTMGLF